MIENLPIYIPLVFTFAVGVELLIFYWIIKNSNEAKISARANWILIGISLWLLIQGFMSINGLYYSNPNSIPPQILLFGIFPNIILIAMLFLTQKGRNFIDSLSIEKITYLNLIRIPIEFILLWLFINKVIPQSMTFEGLNYDLIMGITAPLIIYFGFRKGKIGKRSILIWNIVGIVLLFNVVIIGLLSAPFPLQKFAFEQPNIGLLYFPFSWLPIFIVPVVILGHLISIRQLIKGKVRS